MDLFLFFAAAIVIVVVMYLASLAARRREAIRSNVDDGRTRDDGRMPEREAGVVVFEGPSLYVQPEHIGTTAPLIDTATRRMTAAFRRAEPLTNLATCGVHVCICGAVSRSYDFRLPDGTVTNSLCIHYLAFHRAEVPATEVLAAEHLGFGEAAPTAAELTDYPVMAGAGEALRDRRRRAFHDAHEQL